MTTVVQASVYGTSSWNGSSRNRKNYAVTMHDNIMPTRPPRVSDAIITEYCS
jgi:hypothetical protein